MTIYRMMGMKEFNSLKECTIYHKNYDGMNLTKNIHTNCCVDIDKCFSYIHKENLDLLDSSKYDRLVEFEVNCSFLIPGYRDYKGKTIKEYYTPVYFNNKIRPKRYKIIHGSNYSDWIKYV